MNIPNCKSNPALYWSFILDDQLFYSKVAWKEKIFSCGDFLITYQVERRPKPLIISFAHFEIYKMPKAFTFSLKSNLNKEIQNVNG